MLDTLEPLTLTLGWPLLDLSSEELCLTEA